MEIINLNLIPGKAWPVAHATQFDKGREFRANLFEGSQVYTLAGDETVDAIIKKPDGNQVIETLVNTADNYVIVTTTEQMTAVAGPSLGEIRITKDDTGIGSLKFILECEQSADTGIESHSEINNLETQVAAIVADQYDADNVVFDAAPTPGHGVGFAVTSEGVKDAIDTAIGGLTIPEELDDLSDVTITSPTNGEILVYNNGVFENQANPASTANFAADYDDTATYNTNDKVIYNGLYYIALEDSITGAWDSTKWALTTVSALTAEELPLSGNDSTPTATAIGPLSSLTTTNKDSLVNAVNEVNGNLGNRLVGAWTADSSSASNTYLTDEITVSAGTYLIVMSYPDISTTTFVASLYNRTTSGVYDNSYMLAQSLGTKAIITAFSGTANLCIASAQSATCNFTNKNRGSIRAIKLSNLY